MAPYDSAGTCFGWRMFYKGENISMERMRNPNILAGMIVMLLEDLSCLNTPARRYTSSIYSVRWRNMLTLSMHLSINTKLTNLYVNFE